LVDIYVQLLLSCVKLLLKFRLKSIAHHGRYLCTTSLLCQNKYYSNNKRYARDMYVTGKDSRYWLLSDYLMQIKIVCTSWSIFMHNFSVMSKQVLF